MESDKGYAIWGVLVDGFEEGIITKRQCAENIVFKLVHRRDTSATEILDGLPATIKKEMLCYFDEKVKPQDFLPNPSVFMGDTQDPEQMLAKAVELRPRYVSIYEALGYLENSPESSR